MPSVIHSPKENSLIPRSSRLTFASEPPDISESRASDVSHTHRGGSTRRNSAFHHHVSHGQLETSRYSFFPHETRSSHVPSRSHHSIYSGARSSRGSLGIRASESGPGRMSQIHPSLRASQGLLAHFENPDHPLYHHDPHSHHKMHHHHHAHHAHHHHHHHGPHHSHGPAPILEEIPPSPTEMIRETFDTYRDAKRRIKELNEINLNNDQIVLFFVASRDARGKIWHHDCNIAERAVSFLIKKIQAGGNLLKINVGDSSDWKNPGNPWKNDPKYKIKTLPTLMVCNTMKRLDGKQLFNMELLIALLKD